MKSIADYLVRQYSKFKRKAFYSFIPRAKSLPKIEENIEESIQASSIKSNSKIELKKIIFDANPNTNYIANLKNVRFHKCIFSKQKIEKCVFQSCEFIDCQFNGSEINHCQFHECMIIESCFFRASISNTYIDPKSFKFKSDWYVYWPNVNASLFQELYKNSKSIYQDAFAMEADIQFRLYTRYVDLFNKLKISKYLQGVFYDVFLGSGYGVTNTLVTTVFLITGFSYVIDGHMKPVGEAGYFSSLYFSIVSFTTVGYGDSTPSSDTFAMALTMFFLLLSVVWGAVVTAIVVKRIVK